MKAAHLLDLAAFIAAADTLELITFAMHRGCPLLVQKLSPEKPQARMLLERFFVRERKFVNEV